MALTGENFKGLNRSRNTKTKDALESAQVAFTNYARQTDSDDWNWDTLHKLENKVTHMEYEVYCEEHEDNRRRTWG